MALELDATEPQQFDPHVIVGYVPCRSAELTLHVGDGARLRSGTVIYRGSVIGNRFETGHHVVVREQVRIGDDVSIWSNTVIDHGCVIGDRVKIHCNCYISQFTVIEDDAFLAPGVTLANDLYPGDSTSAAEMAGPTIGAGAQIGVNVTILPYVSIGAGAIIGAGAVVTKDIPPNSVARGCPAVVTGPVRDAGDVAGRVRARALDAAANRGSKAG